MATPRNPVIQGGVVPVAGPDGSIQWQNWQYGELVQHLNNDLSPDSSTLDLASISTGIDALQPQPWRAYRAANQAITATTWTTVLLDTVSWGDAARLVSNQYQVPVAGVYHVSGVVGIATGNVTDAFFATFVSVNTLAPGTGTAAQQKQQFYGSQANWATGSQGQPTSVFAGDTTVAAGDLITLWLYSTVAGNIGGTAWLYTMSVHKVH